MSFADTPLSIWKLFDQLKAEIGADPEQAKSNINYFLCKAYNLGLKDAHTNIAGLVFEYDPPAAENYVYPIMKSIAEMVIDAGEHKGPLAEVEEDDE